MKKKKNVLRCLGSSIALTATVGLSTLSAQQAEAATSSGMLSPVTPKDVVYQIITDRFVDGDTSNNIPTGSSASLFDDPDQDGLGNGDDLKLYQGGDWQGIIDKISYLKNMGVTAVWISAPYENRDTPIYDYQQSGGYDLWTSFHGYHVRNYFATNKHFGLMQDFEALRDALHANGIKLIIDFVSNHTSRGTNPTSGNSPEDGKLYEPDKDSNGDYVFDSNGNPVDYNSDGNVENLLADPNYDINGWFHNLGDRGSDDTQFGYRFKDLGSLSDFSTENAAVVEHLEKAATFWKSKGVDGFRHDATLHMSPSFAKGFKDAIDSASGGPLTHFGEFFIGRPDPKYDEYQSFPDRTGINNLDFEYFRASTNAFGYFSETMSAFGQMLIATSADYEYENQAITFLDNHDVTRFRYIQPNDKPYHAALATLLTARGTPNIYYGTEQYLTSADSSDISGRVFMERETSFDQTTTAYKIIQALSALRRQNEAVAYGETAILYSSDDVLVFKRQFYDKQVIVAVNRQPDLSFTVPAINTTLPAGSYDDVLNGLLYGDSMTVNNGKIGSFTLAGGEVSVWSYNPDLGTAIPRIGDVVSTMGRAGNTVYIYGTGLGGTVTVKFDSTAATVVSNSDTMIEAIVPNVSAGVRQITVTKGTNVSNQFRYEVLSDDQNQVIFKVNATTSWGENIYIVGDIPELGSWDTSKAVGPFHTPNYPEWFLPVSVPKNTTIQYKFIKKDSSGNVTWEGGNNRSITSPSSSTGTLDTSVLTWQ
ncbi:alpha-amylase family glycosyl hydrolase [Microbulbifer thermotolerans]|uniref:alpha-amylase family glycosyl hydrolase n=1 Tax=Microbulbifer thermotolerans TaxID=252514 RepID=UPI002248A6BD|nr:alpha-amylase family glycosyl hydrolase [Microbulbifer thermotolerans]MCX2832366.1 alpha-amylase family glycosyl hydrolase [Microbulbifer thermotolerans]MCX2842887.1 alpha-amylase family glycosyl hydrolase [Microbulbifer thermotolerans]